MPFNQIFIDPFAEAIKNHDIMDVAFSKFRNHRDPTLYDSRIVIVNTGITDRPEVAAAIDYFEKKDVGAIGIDLMFDTVYHLKGDTLLNQALSASSKAVLGFSFKELKGEYSSVSDLKSDPYFANGISKGYVNIASNDGFSIRAFEPFHKIGALEEKAFAVSIIEKLDTTITKDLKSRNHVKEWINFRRKQPGLQNEIFPINKDKVTHYTQINIDRLLSDTALYKREFWKDKIILMGFCGESDQSFSMKDRYYTPLNEQYSGKSYPDMHGVVIHANIISMLLDRKTDMINDVSDAWVYFISFCIFFANYFIFRVLLKKHLFFLVPLVRVIQILQFILFFSLCIYLLVNFNIKLSFITIITAVILSFELFEFYEHKLKKRMQSRVESFAQFLTTIPQYFKTKKIIIQDEINID